MPLDRLFSKTWPPPSARGERSGSNFRLVVQEWRKSQKNDKNALFLLLTSDSEHSGHPCSSGATLHVGENILERLKYYVVRQSEYSARNLSVLEGLEAVRKRPGMYIGSTDSRGLMHCLWEIIDNSVDEALGGYGQSIDITLYADGSVEVSDNGRGIPIDIEPRTGLSGVEVVFTKLHAGGKFSSDSYAAAGGLHGVGAAVVNALSSRLDVQVTRGGKIYQLSFKRGQPGQFIDQ